MRSYEAVRSPAASSASCCGTSAVWMTTVWLNATELSEVRKDTSRKFFVDGGGLVKALAEALRDDR